MVIETNITIEGIALCILAFFHLAVSYIWIARRIRVETLHALCGFWYILYYIGYSRLASFTFLKQNVTIFVLFRYVVWELEKHMYGDILKDFDQKSHHFSSQKSLRNVQLKVKLLISSLLPMKLRNWWDVKWGHHIFIEDAFHLDWWDIDWVKILLQKKRRFIIFALLKQFGLFTVWRCYNGPKWYTTCVTCCTAMIW